MEVMYTDKIKYDDNRIKKNINEFFYWNLFMILKKIYMIMIIKCFGIKNKMVIFLRQDLV